VVGHDWDVEFYADEHGREPCREWAEKLSPLKRAAFRAAVETLLVKRGLDVVSSEFGKALGKGLYELRLRQTAEEIRQRVAGLPPEKVGDELSNVPEKILLRIFFCTSGSKIILLLSAYDKAESPGSGHQDREIASARKLLTSHLEAGKRVKKQARKR
jgi:hypothetical protein